jgi:Tol biopolymer transport system component
VTALVSVSTNGGFGNQVSYLPAISGDGRYVLFSSQAKNLAAGTYANDNLFLRDLQMGRTFGLTSGGYIAYSMTPDGQYIAFIGVAGGNTNLFVWNSAEAAMVYTNTASGLTSVSISPDAHLVAYVADALLFAQDLTSGTNVQIAAGPFSPRAGLKFSNDGRFLAYAGSNDVYLYDFQSGTNLLVSHAFDSTSPANGLSDSPVISADGRFVAFRSFASNCIAAGDFNGDPNIFLFDRLTNSTVLASMNLSGTIGKNFSLAPVFAGDGQTLVFQSSAPDLVGDDFSLSSDVFELNTFLLAASTNQPASFDAQIIFTGDYSSPGMAPAPVVAWPFTPGRTYSVQYKNNLTDPIWQDLPGAVTFIGNRGWFNAAARPVSPQQFYRVVSGN